jgi:DNA-binding GntR family transcriptional regulator
VIPVPSIVPPTRHVAVLGELRKRIVEAKLRPGDQIFADAIADELHVSRIPVREALRVLEGEGQVSYEPHRGYFVAELRLSDLIELYLMREALEAEGLRRSVPDLDREDFARMRAAMEDLEAAHESGDIIAHVAANRRFHFAFLEHLAMPRLRRQIMVLYDQCDPYGSLYYNERRNRQRVKREHLELLRAARRHDVDAVVGLLSAHRQHVVDTLSGTLPSPFSESGAPNGDADADAVPARPRARARARARRPRARKQPTGA